MHTHTHTYIYIYNYIYIYIHAYGNIHYIQHIPIFICIYFCVGELKQNSQNKKKHVASRRVASSLEARIGCATVGGWGCARRSCGRLGSIVEGGHMDVGQNPVPPVNLKVDGHPIYHMISRFWPIPVLECDGNIDIIVASWWTILKAEIYDILNVGI